MSKIAFSTSAYSGPLNPVIASGASYQPPRKMPQLASAIQKTAELWPGFFSEMLKHAAEAVPGGVNVGQWWEQVGGPHLAQGGDHKTFKKMMMDAGIPENFQKKFERLAQEKYPVGHNTRRATSGGVPGYDRWANGFEHPDRASAIKGWATQAIPAMALSSLPYIYGKSSPQKEDPRTPYEGWKGLAGAGLATVPGMAAAGHALGTLTPLFRPGIKHGPMIGGAIGAALGGGIAYGAHRSNESAGRRRGEAAAATGRAKSLLRDASKTQAANVAEVSTMLPFLAAINSAGTSGVPIPTGRGLMMGATRGALLGLGGLGAGMLQKRRHAAGVEAYDQQVGEKAAAGAPTRGNFMMASDIPAFKAPRLDRAIQKDGALETKAAESGGMFRTRKDDDAEEARLKKEKDADMLSDYVTYNAGDFKRSKYAMSMEAMSTLVEGLLKEGSISSARSQLSTSQHVGAPKASAPPGPSIADIAKPKGAHFGSGIAGAFKGGIGGTAPVGLK